MCLIGNGNKSPSVDLRKPTVGGHDQSSNVDDPSSLKSDSSLKVPEKILVWRNDHCNV